jgi:hypothetical protein
LLKYVDIKTVMDVCCSSAKCRVDPDFVASKVIKALISWNSLAREYRQRASNKKDDQHVSSAWLASFYRPLQEAVVGRRTELVKLSVPALLYAGQNNLLVHHVLPASSNAQSNIA